MGCLINQESNYAGDFGAAFRSSAIFYKPKNVKTILSFSNYWEFKNSLSVGLLVTFRDMNGGLVARREVDFADGNVLNIEVQEVEEGSVEVEAFSCKNLRIPYAAIMAVYETENSISMVHSYGRNHSLIELEDGKGITQARESCWTLRASENISNLAIFHNGHVALEEQEGKFSVVREDGTEETAKFVIPALKPFETFVFDAEQIFPQLVEYLDDGIGWGTLHFESQSSFTRLLIVWKNSVTGEVQVTHSNFDYSSHETNTVDSAKPAYMVLPTVYGEIPDVLVYPKFSSGTYLANGEDEFSSGLIMQDNPSVLSFSRTDGELPARIVTAVTGACSYDVSIPYECSLGVVHEKRPPKRFHWFLVSSVLPSVIHITAYDKIYPSTEAVNLVVRLYSDSTKEIDEVLLSYESLASVPSEISVDEIFNLSGINNYGCISIFSHYGGFFVFSSLRKKNVVTLEHSF